MAVSTTLQAIFSRADQDLRARITKVVEDNVIIPFETPVPIDPSCSPINGKYRVIVSSKWLPERTFEKEFSESSLKNLDADWQNFCKGIEKAFMIGPLKFK